MYVNVIQTSLQNYQSLHFGLTRIFDYYNSLTTNYILCQALFSLCWLQLSRWFWNWGDFVLYWLQVPYLLTSGERWTANQVRSYDHIAKIVARSNGWSSRSYKILNESSNRLNYLIAPSRVQLDSEKSDISSHIYVRLNSKALHSVRLAEIPQQYADNHRHHSFEGRQKYHY